MGYNIFISTILSTSPIPGLKSRSWWVNLDHFEATSVLPEMVSGCFRAKGCIRRGWKLQETNCNVLQYCSVHSHLEVSYSHNCWKIGYYTLATSKEQFVQAAEITPIRSVHSSHGFHGWFWVALTSPMRFIG